MTYENKSPIEPTVCPLCKGKLVLRWRGQIMSKLRGYTAQAWPFFVCEACEITVRISALPEEPLRKTADEARQDVADELLAKHEARARRGIPP